MTTKICGWEVVRIPERCFDPEGVGFAPRKPLRVDGIPYGGIDRMEWFDIVTDKINGKLPSDIAAQYQQVSDNMPHPSALSITQDLELARSLLTWSNRTEHRNEIVGIYSPQLSQFSGEVDIDSSRVEHLGVEFVLFGSISLLHEGMYTHPTVFASFRPQLNSNGVFDSEEILDDYVRAYKSAPAAANVEPLPAFDTPILPYSLYRLNK